MGIIPQFLVLCCLVVTFINQSSSASTCLNGCQGAAKKSDKYNYAPGSIYTYNIDSNVAIRLSGNDAQETTVKISGVAQLFVEGNCGFTLNLQRFVVDTNGVKHPLGAEFSKPTQFVLTNDEVAPEICADDTDNEFSLNLKKAIISIIQSASDKHQETDIFGTCPTSFSVSEVAGTTVVNKVRNLNLCAHRESLVSGFITSVVNENSGVRSSPLLNGDYTIEQRIKNGVLESAIANEEYSFVPFSAGDAGARVKVVTSLRLTGTSAGAAPKIAAPTSKSVIFQNPSVTSLSNLNTVKTVLKNTILSYQNNVGSNAAQLFVELIRLMRNTNRNDLLSLYNNIKSGSVDEKISLARKIYYDALFRTGTGESVEACTNLLRSREMNEEEARLMYLSLNLVNSMTKEALNSIGKLMDGNPPKEAYLTVGNLVSKYCRQHSCEGNEIKAISDKFVSKLNNCKADNRAQEDNVIAVLKGLRNTQKLMGPALDKVSQCTNEKNSIRIRVASLQALAAAGCNQKADNVALRILKNRNEDSEIRIEAYLAAVACPNAHVANEIKALLDDEPVNQVGSYITSHIAAIRASVDPTKAALKQYLGNIRSAKKFPHDFRRYSFNHEFSYGIDSLGIGGSMESSVIYSQKSFLPRSSTLNFTGEIFGNTFNVFEMTARQENLDRIIESYIGPKGFFRFKDVQDAYNKLVKPGVEEHKQEQKRGTPGHPRNRASRATKEESVAFAKAVSMGNEVSSDMDLDISYKMFGTEMFFLSLGHYTQLTPSDIFNQFQAAFFKGLDGAKNYQKVFENHALFLDADLVYPTSIGFPIKLLAQGSGVVRLEVKSEIDIMQIIEKPTQAKVGFTLVPSANILIAGTIMLDAYAVNSGLQVSGSLHSSTGIDVKFSVLNDGKGVDLQVGLPVKKQEIFTFDHQIVFVTQEKGKETVARPLKFNQKNKKQFDKARFDNFNDYLGVTFYTDVVLTVPTTPGSAPFPLSGSNFISVSLETEKAFHFQGLIEDSEIGRAIVFNFNTPGSAINRKSSLKFEYGFTGDSAFARSSLQSPFRSGLVEAGGILSQQELAIYAKAESGDQQYYSKLGFTKSGSKNRVEYTPVILVKTPGKTDSSIFGYKIEGKIIVESSPTGTKYSFNDLKLKGDGEANALNGQIIWSDNRITSNVALSRGNQRGELVGFVEFHTKTDLSIKADLAFKSNIRNLINQRLLLNLLFGDTQKQIDVSLVYGDDPESKTKRVDFFYNLEFVGEKKTPVKHMMKINAGFIPANLIYEAKNPSDSEASANFDIGYAKTKFNYNWRIKLNPKSPGAYEFQFGTGFNEHNFNVASKLEYENGKNRITNKLITSIGVVAEVNGVFTSKFDYNDADVNIEVILVPGDKQESYHVNFVVLATPQLNTYTGKFTIGKVEQASYDVKLTKAQNTIGKAEFTVKGILNGKGDLKMLNNKGDGTINVNLIKLGRKLKNQFSYSIDQSHFDLTSELFYDSEKDNTKRVKFTTNNKFESSGFDSKNVLDVLNEKYQFNTRASRIGQVDDGTIKGFIQIILPTGRALSGEFDRQVHLTKTESGTGNIKLTLEDQLPNKKSRKIVFGGKINSANFRARLFDIVHTLQYSDFENRQLNVENHIKNLPKGNFKTAALTFTASGNLIQTPVNLAIDIDEYDEFHATYTVNGKYGNHVVSNVRGKFDLGGRSKKSSFEIIAKTDIPSGKVKIIVFESSGSLLRPETDGGVYAINLGAKTSLDQRLLGFTTTLNGNNNRGQVNVVINVPDTAPFTADVSYLHEEHDDNVKCGSTFSFNYGKGNTIKGSAELNAVLNKDYSFKANVQTPYENAKNVEILFKTAKSSDEHFNVNAKLIADGKTFGWNTAVVSTATAPTLDVDIVYPGKNVKFYSGFQRLGERKYKGQLTVKNFAEFNFDGSAECSFATIETFYLKADIDSPTLKLNKVHFEMNAKPGSGGRGIAVKATSNGANILEGVADFTVKEERGKTIVEGSGNVKVYDKQRVAKFDFVRTNYDLQRDGEAGVLFAYHGQVGQQNIEGELKLTDRNFHVVNKVCEDKQQCIKFEIRSALKHASVENFKHELLVAVDLRQFGYDHEFGLKAETTRVGIQFDHTLDIHFNTKDNAKYQYSFYVHPKSTGAILTLPSRVIALEGNYDMPQNDIFGNYETRLSLYTDKRRKPQHRSYIGFTGQVTKSAPQAVKVDGAFKITHPSISPLQISGNAVLDGTKQTANGHVEFDIFNAPNKKIIIAGQYGNTEVTGAGFNTTAEVTVSSAGLAIDLKLNGHAALSLSQRQFSMAGTFEAPKDEILYSVYVYGSEQLAEVLVRGYNEEIVNAQAKIDTKKEDIQSKATIRFLGGTPVVITSRSTATSLIFDVTRGTIFSVKGELTLNKEGRLEIHGSGKELFKGRVALDKQKFLATEYKVQDDEVKTFLKTFQTQLQTDADNAQAEIKKRLEKTKISLSTKIENVQKALPDFERLQKDIKIETQQIHGELMADKTTKQLLETIHALFEVFSRTFNDIYYILLENFQKMSQIITEFYATFSQMVTEKILPIFRDAYNEVQTIVLSLYRETVNVLSALFERTIKALKTFEEDFNKIGKTFGEIFKNAATIINKNIAAIRKELRDLIDLVVNHIRASAAFETIVTEFNKLIEQHKIPEQIIDILKEITNLVKNKIPVPEVRQLIEQSMVYIEAKVTKKPINDAEQLKTIYIAFMNAVRSVVSWVTSQVYSATGVVYTPSSSSQGIFAPIPFSLETIKNIPIVSNFKFSPYNYMKSERPQSIRDILQTYYPRGLDFCNWVPPFNMHAVISDGEHYFTFDGRHMTFPGTCNYILAQDFVDGNFSVIGNLKQGKMKSITLVDKQNTIELNDNGVVTLNGKPSELPIHKNDIHAWRNYYSITLMTGYGAEVFCTDDLRTCHFTVNGFYLGKIRGLLGNGNGEPYDDFTMPNNKITDNFADFGNAYKTNKGCAAVPFVDHSAHAHADKLCSELFAGDSPLRMGFYFVNPNNYEEACNHAVSTAKDKQDALCNIAQSYVSACRLQKIPVTLPSKCAKCNTVSVGDTFSTKVPQKQADVVLVVDVSTATTLTDFTQILITDLRRELKARDIDDTRIVVIGYDQNQKYTKLFTQKGKIDVTGNLNNLILDGPTECKPLVTGNPKLDPIFANIHKDAFQIREIFGQTADAKAFAEAFRYPFRSGAIKIIVAIRGDSLDYMAGLKTLMAVDRQMQVAEAGIALHLVTPINDLIVRGGKQPKDIVGFNKKAALLISDKSKNKIYTGNADLRRNLQFKHDLGIDMVEQADGYIYNLANYNTLKVQQQKKNFMNVVAGSIADLASRTEIVSECVCKIKYGLFAEEVCSVKDKKTHATILKKPGNRG